jgi:nucleoside diphosphate kinase
MGSGASKKKSETLVDGKLLNSAFVFIKPHANNETTQKLVSSTLQAKGLKIVKEGEFKGEEIDKGMLIDQHYYAIASKATLLKANQIPVPNEKFQESFGLPWETALAENRAFNAVDAMKELGVDLPGLDALWAKTTKIKFGGGFYCGEIKRDDKPSIFVFNAFFMTMRNKFVAPTASIHYYVVEFDPAVLSWKDFRGQVLGPTDPKTAPPDSLRGKMLAEWQSLGMTSEPNVSDNCVHASASPFEGLAEKMNWLKLDPKQVSLLLVTFFSIFFSSLTHKIISNE